MSKPETTKRIERNGRNDQTEITRTSVTTDDDQSDSRKQAKRLRRQHKTTSIKNRKTEAKARI